MIAYLWNDAVYETEDDVSEAIADYIIDVYPEIVHSDFIAEESGEFDDEWQYVEEIEVPDDYFS